MNRKIVIKGIKILCVAVILYLIIPKFRFRYYYSKNHDRVLTQVTYPNIPLIDNTSYLTPGRYKRYAVPDVYIKPMRQIINNDWFEIIYFHSNGIFINGVFADTLGLSDSFMFLGNTIVDYNDARKINKIINSLSDTSTQIINSFK